MLNFNTFLLLEVLFFGFLIQFVLLSYVNVNMTCANLCPLHDPMKPICSSFGKTIPDTKLSLCYFACNITALHAFSCECPNNCYSFRGQGICVNSERCTCLNGWSGRDCSEIECPGNTCSGHGRCISSSPNTCQCDVGWTGPDCSSPISPTLLNPLPFGIVFPDEPYYYRDEFKDIHPIFNMSVVATIKIQVDGILDILQPWKIWENDFIPGIMTLFDNGNIKERNVKIHFRVKGKASRSSYLKNWIVSFDEHPWYGMERFALKKDTYYFRDPLSHELTRAFGVIHQRSSFAFAWINGIAMGTYWFAEEHGRKEFLQSRFSHHKGNLYKVNRGHLLLEGNGTPMDYQMANRGFAYGRFRYKYDQSGDGKFTDLSNLVWILNQTTDDVEFRNLFSKVFNIEQYLRWLIVEQGIVWSDGYTTTGNNHYLYFHPITGICHFMPFDLQSSFQALDPENRNIYTWYKIVRWGSRAALTERLILAFRERYTELWRLFLERIWTLDSERSGRVHQRIKDMMTLLTPMLERDYVWHQFSANRTLTGNFIPQLGNVLAYINKRNLVAKQQLDP